MHENEILGRASTGAPMASFASGFNGDKGEPLMIDIVSTGAQGVAVSWWSAPVGQRCQEVRRPDVMGNVRPFSAVAAGADRHVDAYEGPTVREYVVPTDGLSWSLVGDVQTV